MNKSWKKFTLLNKEKYFLNELEWELNSFESHPLKNKNFRILKWLGGYDHFIIQDLSSNEQYEIELHWGKKQNNDINYTKLEIEKH